MNLDIRLPIGLLFATLGALLAAFGLASDRAIYRRSLDLNVNLWWGATLLAFGVVMIALGRRKPAPRPPSAAETPQGPHAG